MKEGRTWGGHEGEEVKDKELLSVTYCMSSTFSVAAKSLGGHQELSICSNFIDGKTEAQRG